MSNRSVANRHTVIVISSPTLILIKKKGEMLYGWYQIVLLDPVQPNVSVLKPANDRHLHSMLSISQNSNLRVWRCSFR